MKVFIPAYFITSGHSVQKWKGTDMESMRDTKRIMEREIKKGSTPLSFEQMEIDTNNYQEITSVEKLTQVLQYLHRVGNYKSLAGKTVINNVYTFMRGRTPDFTRARSIFDREKIYHQMLRQEKKMNSTWLCWMMQFRQVQSSTNQKGYRKIYSVKADMRSKGFVSAFFIATTSGHSVQKWKGKEMNRKNMKKLLFAAIAVVIVAKVVRDTKNAKKQKENIPADTFNDFYEEELNWWDKDLKEGEK